MKIKVLSLRRTKYAFGALLMAFAAALPSLLPGDVSAAQITARSIKMSSSTASAAGVSYEVSFKPGSSYNLQGIVIDFCNDSPIIGASTCTTTTSAVAVGSSPTVSAITGAPTGTWTAGQLNSQRTLTLANSGTNNVTSASTITFTVSNVTNPNPTGNTFYARIYTYASNTAPASYTLASPGTYSDAGGVALSTTQAISVSGTVAETLTFCTSGAVIATCASTTAPTLTLGSGTPQTIDSATLSTGNIYSQISTNAGSGAVIRLKNQNACGGLSKNAGTTCELRPVGHTTGSTTNALSSAPSPDGLFGMKAASTGTTGTLTTSAPYNTADYGFDSATVGDNVTTTYGDTVASSTGILDTWNTTYTFGVRPSTTTPAGVYTATLSLIATGTY
jgi:hypothetical protein